MNPLRLSRGLSPLFIALLFAQACAEVAVPTGEKSAELPATNDAGEPFEVAVSAQALTPVAGCIDVVYDGRDYRWCAPFVPWQAARDACVSYGLDLVSIQDPAENAFVAQLAGGVVPMWIGANDVATENTWVWSNGNVPFLTGSIPGTPVMGRYENFPTWEPVPDGGALDCANIRPGTAGAWFTTSCLEFSTFVCETADACPGDPLKVAPGVCGCGVADTDSDGDTVQNCIDLCPSDRFKTDPGIMGCGVADTDSDGDGVPNAIDEASTDVNVQVIGTCGTAAAPALPGTPCDDAPCPGRFTCDGAGRCGTAMSCPVPNGCGTARYRRFQNKGYWFCTGPAVWSPASQNCRLPSDPGRALVEIESAAENAFVTANLTADMWIGGSDTGAEGTFRWATAANNNGQRFWSGSATGTPSFSRYSKWLAGEPSASTGTDDCVTLIGTGANRGRWDVRNCDNGARGFVCETPGPELRITSLNWPESPTLDDLYGLPPTLIPPWSSCVSENAFPLGAYNSAPDDGEERRVLGEFRNCAMGGACTGAAAPPATTERCPAWNSAESSLCMIQTASLAVGGQLDFCTIDADCGAPHATTARRCGFYRVELLPTGKWRTDRVCGTPDDNCPDPSVADPAACRETTICQIQNQQTLSTFSAPGADLTPGPLAPNATFGVEPPDPPVTPYADQSNPCPTGINGACNRDENHLWCNYDVNDSVLTTNKSLNGAGTGRSGDNNSGAEDLISFGFDPRMLLEYDAGVGALGLPTANLKAEAGLKAGIKLGRLVVDLPDFDVIDVLAAVHGSQCGLTTGDSYVRLLEKDFVPGPWGDPELAGPLAANKTRCEELYTQFQDAADRANKALRDAAYLIRQYRALPAGTGFGNLCTQLAATAPRGFPASTNCALERPETTIARFISYYRSTVLGGFPASAGVKGIADIASEFAALSGGSNALEFGGTIEVFATESEPEELTIVEAQFFIGPIPCNLEVYAALSYGVDVTVNWLLNPGGAINTMLFSPGATSQVNIARLGIEGEPHATALLGVFAGAGFSVGPVAAKFGVDAQLTLGTISVPAFAYAGLNLGAERESASRALPAEFDLMSSPSPEYLVPPKRYSVSLVYGAGLSARVSNVLNGDVAARLKLRFFLFSKSWRKRLFSFTGLPSQEFSLVSLEGALPIAAFDDHGWGKVVMPSPFPAILGPVFVPGTPVPPTTIPAPTGPVEEFFYDNLCTCIQGNTDQKTGLTRDCVRTDDCCASTPRCFSDPALTPAGRNSCVGSCRPRGTSCRAQSDCCTAGDKCFNDPIDSLNYGSCSACRAPLASCTVDNDCCNTATHGCYNGQGAPSHRQCLLKGGCYSPCNSDLDCTSALYCQSSTATCRLRVGTCTPQ